MTFLSIVIPTREGFADRWVKELVKVEGDVEFIWVHPPGMQPLDVEDKRIRQIISPFRGEIIQRLNGLLNATGIYIVTINCDEYITPNLTEITRQYFEKFPDSWVMRLAKKQFDFGDVISLEAPWQSITTIEEMQICSQALGNKKLYGQPNYMLEIPIAPLDNKFDFGCFFRARKDHHGPHTENFDKKVWKTEMVRSTLEEIVKTMNFVGPFKYLPFWCLDRLLGLFLQAKFFESGKIIGHLLPMPEQLRVEDNPPEHQRKNRFYVFAEVLLLRRFTQYGYIWNLMVDHIRSMPYSLLRSLLGK